MPIKVEWEWCKGCGVCIDKCPVKALEVSKYMNKKGYFPPTHVKDHRCNNCKLCEFLCPDFAIGVFEEGTGEKSENVKEQGGECAE